MEELIELLLSGDQKIRSLYNDLAKGAREIISGYKGPMGRNNALLRGPMERLLKKFRTRLYFLLHFNIHNAQVLAHIQADRLVSHYTAGMGISGTLKSVPLEGMRPGSDTSESISGRLSPRVWELTRQNGKLMELYIRSGVKEGSSASEMTRDLRQFLKEPDKLFRRIKNEKGRLELSKAAREYHPGAGVYRSSYKNALRLSRTETNMAYRRAEHEHWQALPFVSGMEIRLSKVHKEGACICDSMQGKYPKNFLFLGWHPQCLCQAVPVMLSREEFIRYG